MTPRDRMLTAIRHQTPDRIPAEAICVENVPALAAALGIAEDAVLDRLGLCGRIVGLGAYAGARPWDAALGPWGVSETGDYGTARANPLAEADRAALARYPWPDADAYDVTAPAAAARACADTYAVRGPYWMPIFCQASALMGIEEALITLATEPVLVDDLLARITDHTLAACTRLLDACGDDMPILCLGDDFASQRGLLMSPALWRRHLKPCYARLFALGKARGKVVWFHSCGDVTAVLPDLLDIGVDVWETVQLHTLPLSAVALKREYGAHLTFFGGVSTQRLPFATPDEVAAETRHCLDVLGEGGGYICGPDHHVKPDVSPANTLALFDTVAGFRRVGYTA